MEGRGFDSRSRSRNFSRLFLEYKGRRLYLRQEKRTTEGLEIEHPDCECSSIAFVVADRCMVTQHLCISETENPVSTNADGDNQVIPVVFDIFQDQ